MKNRRGTDKLLSVYWFAILFIVVAGIVYITYSFYGEPYDVRSIEADLLTNKIADCLSSGGVLIGNFKTLNESDFLKTCYLNFNVEDTSGWNDDQFFVRVEFTNIAEDGLDNSVSFGNFNLEDFCATGKVVCIERNMYALSFDGGEQKAYSVKIKSIVNKYEKNSR